MDCFANEKDKTEACTQPRRRRSRTVFSPDAIFRMEEIFNKNRYPDIQERDTLAMELNIPEPRIQVWFQNRRSRTKKCNSSKGKSHSIQPVTNKISPEAVTNQTDQSVLSKDNNTQDKEKEQTLSVIQQGANIEAQECEKIHTRQDTHIHPTAMSHSQVSDILHHDWLSLTYNLSSFHGWFPSIHQRSQQEFTTSSTSSNREIGNNESSFTLDLHTSGSSSEDECIVDRLFRFSKSRQQNKDKKRKCVEGAHYRVKVPRINKVDCSVSEFERSEDRRSDITSTAFSMYPYAYQGFSSTSIY